MNVPPISEWAYRSSRICIFTHNYIPAFSTNNLFYFVSNFHINKSSISSFPAYCTKKDTGKKFLFLLCVLASGVSLIFHYMVFYIDNKFFLHFGQNKGKFFSSVSSKTCVLVFALHSGHRIHLSVMIDFTFPRLL